MHDSNIVWIEMITHICLVFPLCYMMERMVGYKRFRGISGAVPMGIIYVIWKFTDQLVVYYPEVFTTDMAVAVIFRITLALTVMFLIVPLFYKGSWIKRLFAYLPQEAIGIISYAITTVATSLLYKTQWYIFLEQKQLQLLLFRIITEIVPFYFTCWIFRKPIRWYKNNEIKRKGLCWLIVGSLFMIELVSGIIQGIDERAFRELWRSFAAPIWLYAFIAFIYHMEKQKNERLILQKNLMENHYKSVLAQSIQTEMVQKEIAALIESADYVENYTESAFGHIENSKKKLSALYEQLQAVGYCNNIIIDSILHNKAQECLNTGIKFDIDIQDIKTGNIEDIELFKVFYDLLEVGIQRAKSNITIKAKNIAGQLMVEMNYSVQTERRDRLKRAKIKGIKKQIKKMEGEYDIELKEGKEKIIIGIPTER